MLRFSVVLWNAKQEVLICETTDIENQLYCEFPGGEIEKDELPPMDEFLEQIHDVLLKDFSIEVCELKKLEMYFREEPFFVHTIYAAKIKSGVPESKKNMRVRWVAIDNVSVESLSLFGAQVFRKLDECRYCQYLRERRDDLDRFFENYFTRAEENLAILDAIRADDKNGSLYLLAFKQEMVHLRASLVENPKLKKNITIQNYFRLYGRCDLAECIDGLLRVKVMEDISLRELIKTSVDKFIAHYDEPSPTDIKIYDYCVNIFSIHGKLPLAKFVRLLDGYIMSLIMQMWYDAGELGISMSDRCFEDKEYLVDYGNTLADQIISAFQNEI